MVFATKPVASVGKSLGVRGLRCSAAAPQKSNLGVATVVTSLLAAGAARADQIDEIEGSLIGTIKSLSSSLKDAAKLANDATVAAKQVNFIIL